jgi:hypothetical protein
LNDEKFCLEKSIQGCDKYDLTVTWVNRATKYCASCLLGYRPVLTNGKITQCLENTPVEDFRIPQCTKYSATIDCDECSVGYVLY